jgi:tetratricopeptide (TPR) repeat protein
MARKQGHPEQAKETFSEAIRLSRGAGDPLLLASALTGLGQIERDLDHELVAVQHYREAAHILKAGPHRLRFAHTVRHLADLLREGGSAVESAVCYEEALRVCREHPETPPLDLANALRGFALLTGGVGDNQEANLLWQEARSLYELVNVQAGVQESERHMARLNAR